MKIEIWVEDGDGEPRRNRAAEKYARIFLRNHPEYLNGDCATDDSLSALVSDALCSFGVKVNPSTVTIMEVFYGIVKEKSNVA